MKPEDVKKKSVNDYLYGEDHVVDERGIATSKEYAGPIPCRRTNSVMVPVERVSDFETRQTNSHVLRGKQIIDVPKKGFLATVKESMTKSGGCCGSGGNCSERPFTSHPIPFEVDMSTSKWRDSSPSSFKSPYRQGIPEKPRSFRRFGIELPILFFRGDIFLFVLIFSAVVALIMTLL